MPNSIGPVGKFEKDPQLLTAAQAASRLSLAKSTVYLLIATRKLPAVRIGRAVRIPADRLASWIALQTIS